MWVYILTLGQFLTSTPYFTPVRNGNNETPGRKIMYGKYQTSVIITDFPKRSSFVFLLEARAELPHIHGS